MGSEFPPCPASLRQIQHYLKTASEHESRDVVVVYWSRLYALQTALKIDKKSDEAKMLLVKLMDWLEKKKKEMSDNEAITNELAAQAHIENYALKLFLWADNQDQNAIFNKNVVKSFYTSGMLMDVLAVFGEVSEDIENKKKYAKWKAAYIHNCLKDGQTPIPGPPLGFEGDEENSYFTQPGTSNVAASSNLNSNYFPDTNSSTLTNESSSDNVPSASDSFPTPLPRTVPSSVNIDPVQPVIPSNPFPSQPAQVISSSGVKLDPAQIAKAQKYCKWAGSALNYDDVPEAISNLQKALRLLSTGEDG